MSHGEEGERFIPFLTMFLSVEQKPPLVEHKPTVVLNTFYARWYATVTL